MPETIQKGGGKGGYSCSQEGGDPRQYSKARVDEVTEVEGRQEGGGLRQYWRDETQGCTRGVYQRRGGRKE